MLRLYCYIDDDYEQRKLFEDEPFEHKIYASELISLMHFEDWKDIQSAYNRAVSVLEKAEIPLEQHFRTVYRVSHEGLTKDLKLSPLAARLLVINSNTDNSTVARVQVKLLY